MTDIAAAESHREDIKEARRILLAAMETGNQGRARSLLVEMEAEFPEVAAALRGEIVAAYGIFL